MSAINSILHSSSRESFHVLNRFLISIPGSKYSISGWINHQEHFDLESSSLLSCAATLFVLSEDEEEMQIGFPVQDTHRFWLSADLFWETTFYFFYSHRRPSSVLWLDTVWLIRYLTDYKINCKSVAYKCHRAVSRYGLVSK